MSVDLLARFLVPEEDETPLGPCVRLSEHPVLMLELVWVNGNRRLLAYTLLGSVDFNLSTGLLLQFGRWRVTVSGQRLREVFDALREHRVVSLSVADPLASPPDNENPVVTTIGVDEIKALMRARCPGGIAMIDAIKTKDATDVIRTQLTEQAKALDQQCEQLRATLGAKEEEGLRLRAALEALDGRHNARRAAVRRLPSTFETEEVIQLLHALLRPDATLSVEELRTTVENEARAANRSCVGLHARLRKALRDTRFIVSETESGKTVRLRSVGTVPSESSMSDASKRKPSAAGG
ncbi:MAG: hypothetical protein IPK83_21260 [Planctomycetes bacterium]|nr:hypothetical protein [Planctomycetota bacterium]